jgi:hypothetical protein
MTRSSLDRLADELRVGRHPDRLAVIERRRIMLAR